MAKKSGGKKQSGRRPAKETGLVPKGYDEFLGQLKERIRSAQLRAAVAVNRELVNLYWQIGQDILARQNSMARAPENRLDRLAKDLRRDSPESRDSPRETSGACVHSTWRTPMRSENCHGPWQKWTESSATAVAEIPWGHNARPAREGQRA